MNFEIQIYVHVLELSANELNEEKCELTATSIFVLDSLLYVAFI